MAKDKMVDRVAALMGKPEMIRNIGIVAHIDHGKTTLSDNLLAGAGMLSKELAGNACWTDSDEEEQERGITIDSANVSMVHEYEGKEYLINLIDTPGHVDFGGDVTRAMRAVDGAVVVIDAVEGTMPQTETVLRQALKEHVKPVLFINKVDRLINELQVDGQEMQIRLGKLIDHVNKLIKGMNEERYKAGWRVDAAEGTVAFGSALYNWAISVPMMQKTGVSFQQIYDYNKADDPEKIKELADKCPLHEVLNDMVIRFLPSPLQAQEGRIGAIWHGDKESQIYKSMINADPNADLAFMVTDITMDPHAGEVATGRLFSGSLSRGMEAFVSGTSRKNRIQQVGVFMGPKRLEVENIPAGNIAAVTGLRDAIVGSTVTTLEGMEPFESITHASEPVVTVAVEAKHMKDLPKLVDVLRQVAKEDPTLKITLDEETGEHLMAGMGELHLEVIAHRIERDKGVEITTTPPIVVYRETIRGSAGPVEGKSPNRHNRFYVEIEPLEEGVRDLIKAGEISMRMPEVERREKLMEAGLDKDQAKGIVDIFESNVYIDMTKGIQHLNETMELILEGFHEVMKGGPLSKEPCMGVKVKLVDAKLHEDAVHRGPAQVIPASRQGIQAAMLMADDTLLEPYQKVFIQVPQDNMGGATKEIQGRRGIIINMTSEGDMTIIESRAPVSELFGFAGDIRSATEGRAMWSTEFAGFDTLPANLTGEIVSGIRERKGLKKELPQASDYLSM
ncbi:elongation factor EF-2 [Methanolobus sp. WCC1]|jgi:elongation factor 2|uniref:Elongation factor 2 n=1 Tax=Methanolobus tindarius DSM 2278 TaxID=1090322 RepID=W9DYI0_METTI|nr:elongation factor EF-2 [Methanolobus tindarius]ETA68762.1 translation elongation factor 2 (EF-2/EF-G) [Methanolobus tindarius DSM 2278]MDI3486022.1 elongation factor 2 [Methanolobus sp.]